MAGFLEWDVEDEENCAIVMVTVLGRESLRDGDMGFEASFSL